MDEPSQELLWESITREPNTGVAIVSLDGEVEYINRQATKIYLDRDRHPDEVVGRPMSDFMPEAFVEERLATFRDVADDRKPRLMRTIWKGLEHHAWLYPVEEGDDDGDEAIGRVFVITHRTADDSDGGALLDEKHFEFVRAEVNDLGPLEDLSSRELVVLALLGQGLTLKEVAGRVHRSLKTVQTQRDSIGRKLGVRSRSQLQEIVVRSGLKLKDVAIDG